MVLVVAVLAVVAAADADAGSVGSVVQATDDGGLALTVSQAYFQGGSAHGVVLTDPGKPGTAAIAAAFAGSGGANRVPLLFVGHGASDALVRAEIKRVTGGPGGADPPTVWLAGAALSGLDGYDVRDLGGSAAAVGKAIVEHDAPSGTAERVLVFDANDWRAGAVAAGFGAAYGVPVFAGGDALPTLATTPLPIAVTVGAVTVPAGRFSRVDKIEGADPAALSAAAADALVAKEHPAGAPVSVPVPVEPVAADGFGTDAGPALLAPVVAAALQADGARPPVLLVDGRPTADLGAGCATGAKDKVALCALDKADAATTVLALTTARRADGAPLGGRLPGTGGRSLPVAAVGLALAAVLVRRLRVVTR
ncbi:MAG: hypothetical protein QOE35_2859 [Actinomycetota bacterium]